MMGGYCEAMRRLHPIKLGDVIDGKRVIKTCWLYTPEDGNVPIYELEGESEPRVVGEHEGAIERPEEPKPYPHPQTMPKEISTGSEWVGGAVVACVIVLVVMFVMTVVYAMTSEPTTTPDKPPKSRVIMDRDGRYHLIEGDFTVEILGE